MMTAPKVSVLIPTYNGAKYVAPAIESVLNQTFTDFELIIADDHSKDRSINIIKKYAKKDKRVRYFVQEKNLGSVGNINSLLLQAKGDYIKILIQDDIMASQYLEEGKKLLDQHPQISLITSYQKFIGDSSEVRKMPTLPAINEIESQKARHSLLTQGNWVGGESATMFRRRDLTVGLFNPAWVWTVDRDMWLRLLSKGNLFVIPQILTYPRVHKGQGTVYLNQGLTYPRENLEQLKIAFLFPQIYGSYSKNYQEKLYEQELIGLIHYINKNKATLGYIFKIARNFRLIGFIKSLIKFYFITSASKIKKSDLAFKFIGFYHDLNFLIVGFYLKLNYNFTFENKRLQTGYGKVFTKGKIKVPIKELVANIWTESGCRATTIENTPHYRWIKDLLEVNESQKTQDNYHKYLSLYYPEENASQGLKKVKKFISSYQGSKNKEEFLTIVISLPGIQNIFTSPNFQIIDGVHRAALACALGKKEIYCRLL